MKSLFIRFFQLCQRHHFALIRVGLALAIAFVVTRFQFDYLESLLYDGRMRVRPAPETSGNIVTIAIDPLTLDQLRRAPTASDHRVLLEELGRLKPKAIMYLIHPTELVGDYDELKRFALTAGQFANFYVAVNDTPLKGTEEGFRPPSPFNALKFSAAPTTADANTFARDSVTRRMFTSYQNQIFLHPILASLYNPEIRVEDNVGGLFNYLESRQAFINFRPAGTYPRFSFVQVMNRQTSESDIAGKIVIVGRDLNTVSKDYIRTPYSREINGMTLIEMHANMLDTLIQNSAFIRAPNWLNLILTALICILTVYVALAVKPAQGLMLLSGAVGVFCLISFLMFWWFEVWVVMAHTLLATFVCYYFFIPYRLIMENRRSWEYFQKNRLLTQVEELKTNFLSMMSHDLKTPIARIQGMTDVVLNEPQHLSETQKEALLTVRKSSEELLEFVSSILNLGRIESKELKLHLQSKDPNQLLKEIIGKYEYLANSKKIEISTELEPMFSLKMDVDLMRQVFSNLIENAIKYSPENTRILVSTEEDHGHIVVQVADQGIGIPDDESGQIFSKFFRSKNAKSSDIKGSGLGLYLAKYFVELHKGQISVDSALGQGTTFTVVLPTNLGDDT